VPHQHVGVARRAIDVGDVGVEPDDTRREIRIGLLDDRIVGDRTGQIVEPATGNANDPLNPTL
jgi:hypothetical protein